jgi:O-antigen/teichoic acid export membrane protein
MPTEARRAVVRIGANYSRLFATLVFGVILVPVLLAWLGAEAFGLISLITASVGIGAMIQDLTRQSLVRELGGALHAGDRGRFRAQYASAFLLAGIGAALTALLFLIIGLIIGLPVFNIEPRMLAAARWMIAAEGVFNVLLVLTAPAFNLYVVLERFILQSVWIVLRRASYLLAALILFFGVGITDPATGIAWYGITVAAFNTLVLAVAVGHVLTIDRDFIPRLGLARRDAFREVGFTLGWNSGVVLATNLHERVPQFVMTAAFGLGANAVFSIALRLGSYVRMVALGVTYGVDAVSTRISAGGNKAVMHSLLRQSTRLHALTALPAGLGVFILAEPLIRIWAGRYLDDPAAVPQAVTLTQIIIVATISRSISDGWVRILYGAGHVRRYAPMVLVGGVLNPLVAIALLLALPADFRFNSPALAFAGVFTLFHMVLLPLIGARCLGVPVRALFTPMLRPAVAAAIPAPILVAATWLPGVGPGWASAWGPWVELGILMGFGAVYGAALSVLVVAFVATPQERVRAAAAMMRALRARRPGT